MAAFSHLPTELVDWIYSYLTQSSLYAVCQVNKSLHGLAVPFLYRHVDLFIPPGNNVPRIDWFCMNILKDRRLAARVETLRLGPTSGKGVKEGQRWVPRDSHFDDVLMRELATDALENESLVSKRDYLRDAIGMREYAAYAALILLVLPSLQELHVADTNCASIDHVHTALRNLNPAHNSDTPSDWNRRRASEALMKRLTSIKTVYFNFNKRSGVAYASDTSRYSLEPVLKLPNIEELEFAVPDGIQRMPNNPNFAFMASQRNRLISRSEATNITRLVVRHSVSVLPSILPLLTVTPQLSSLTYEFYYDEANHVVRGWNGLDLSEWSDALPRTLNTLVFSFEYCDTEAYYFKQPSTTGKLHGYLDLTNFTSLHTLEVPFPFLTGDAEFLLATDVYPLLPPHLRHLTLRTDISRAQHIFPFDTSVLSSNLTFQESESEARWRNTARMDLSYMFYAAVQILDFASTLETISIWQPADPGLSWFDGQVADFAQTCRNKSIKGHFLHPMLLRWKKPEHWDLVKEVTVFNPQRPKDHYVESFQRVERSGAPLGLASQYHLHALGNHQVRLR